MEPIKLIQNYYRPDSEAYSILIAHSSVVARKALEIAKRVAHMYPDEGFIYEAAMLHDIGIIETNAPGLGCYGSAPYIAHGYLGRQMLELECYNKHALICERHVGVGLTVEDIQRLGLALPLRDMVPITLEEKIVCYADKFFTKKRGALDVELPVHEVRRIIGSYGEDKLRCFDDMDRLFKDT